MKFLKIIKYATAGWLPGGQCYCPICKHSVWRFMPFLDGKNTALMEALNIIGSDIRNHECPHCGSHDRERHLFLYMQAIGLLEKIKDMRILHFAPERRLSKILARQIPAQYIRADLYPNSADVQKVNIEKIPFPDHSFDLVIANHVLEHVQNDFRATKEIHRVLAPSGWAILQTPYCETLQNTWSDPGITTRHARLQAYGQEDHARLFGQDIFSRIASSGLHPHTGTHTELLPDVPAGKFGVNTREPFFLFHKTPDELPQ